MIGKPICIKIINRSNQRTITLLTFKQCFANREAQQASAGHILRILFQFCVFEHGCWCGVLTLALDCFAKQHHHQWPRKDSLPPRPLNPFLLKLKLLMTPSSRVLWAGVVRTLVSNISSSNGQHLALVRSTFREDYEHVETLHGESLVYLKCTKSVEKWTP